MLDPELVTRARGALLGLVAGNQLGVPTEHLGTPAAIRAAFPDGVRTPAAPPKGSLYDDDAAMTLLLAESLAESGDFDAVDAARRWVRWMKADGRGIGVTTRRALKLVERGVEPGEFGYVVHCVEIAFWFATHDRGLEDSLTYLANAGGDTDTNAAVAGALLGARYGESGIPPRWAQLIAGADGVRRLADRLVEAQAADTAGWGESR